MPYIEVFRVGQPLWKFIKKDNIFKVGERLSVPANETSRAVFIEYSRKKNMELHEAVIDMFCPPKGIGMGLEENFLSFITSRKYLVDFLKDIYHYRRS